MTKAQCMAGAGFLVCSVLWLGCGSDAGASAARSAKLRAGSDRDLWKFLKAHPFGVSPEPYAAGLPADFPTYCKIIK